MIFKKYILAAAYRPLLIPLGVGAFGLWYGSYDISHKVFSKVIKSGTHNPVMIKNRTLNAQVVSNFSGLTTGVVTIYFSKYLFPPLPVNYQDMKSLPQEAMKLSQEAIKLRIARYVEIFKIYPFQRLFGAIILSSSMSAFVSVCAERYIVG